MSIAPRRRVPIIAPVNDVSAISDTAAAPLKIATPYVLEARQVSKTYRKGKHEVPVLRECDFSAVSGKVTLDGHPVGWGSVTFLPENTALPYTTARVMGGKFSLPQPQGPPVGKCHLSFTASIWETTKVASDRVIQRDRLSQSDAEPATIEVTPGLEPLQFALTTD